MDIFEGQGQEAGHQRATCVEGMGSHVAGVHRRGCFQKLTPRTKVSPRTGDSGTRQLAAEHLATPGGTAEATCSADIGGPLLWSMLSVLEAQHCIA